MNQTVTLVLLLAGTSTMPEERRALGALQTREKIALTSPVAGAPTTTPPYTPEVALHVEAELDEAQTLATSLDEERALVLLAEVERELLLHPELPQAAWLMAERHQLAAAIRKKQPGGEADALSLARSAAALEGPRAASFGDGDSETSFGADASASALLAVRGLDPADSLVLDGRPASREERVLPGRHHARVFRGSSVVFASFIEVPAQARVERALEVPARVPCSEQDLAEVSEGTLRPSVPRGVRCERWMGLRRGRSGLEITRCERDACSPYEPLPADKPAPVASIPPWLAATLVGAATLGAGAILLLSGTFDREKPSPTTTWVYQGSK